MGCSSTSSRSSPLLDTALLLHPDLRSDLHSHLHLHSESDCDSHLDARPHSRRQSPLQSLPLSLSLSLLHPDSQAELEFEVEVEGGVDSLSFDSRDNEYQADHHFEKYGLGGQKKINGNRRETHRINPDVEMMEKLMMEKLILDSLIVYEDRDDPRASKGKGGRVRNDDKNKNKSGNKNENRSVGTSSAARIQDRTNARALPLRESVVFNLLETPVPWTRTFPNTNDSDVAGRKEGPDIVSQSEIVRVSESESSGIKGCEHRDNEIIRNRCHSFSQPQIAAPILVHSSTTSFPLAHSPPSSSSSSSYHPPTSPPSSSPRTSLSCTSPLPPFPSSLSFKLNYRKSIRILSFLTLSVTPKVEEKFISYHFVFLLLLLNNSFHSSLLFSSLTLINRLLFSICSLLSNG